jgi:hypothetical protein
MIERLITFVVLGFFVFVADFGGWWQAGGLAGWHSNFILWLLMIVACYMVTNKHSGDEK